MKTNKNIQDKIESTFNAADALQDVKVSPFFKDKVMQRLYAEKEEKQTIWSWFTPQLQLATLVCVVLLNVFAFTQLDSNANDVYAEEINEFAQTYDLADAEDTSLFN